MVGTIGYMSPEQMMGRDIGPQSDIFSAGVVLYEMATGTRPFPGRSLGEVLDATLNRPLAFSSSSSHIPADLEHITRKALAKRLDERYGSAEDMFIDLRALRRRLESGDSSPALRRQGAGGHYRWRWPFVRWSPSRYSRCWHGGGCGPRACRRPCRSR